MDALFTALRNYQIQPLGKQRKSAVLIPLIKREGTWHILYEVRSHLVSQAGTSSFPGGRVEGNESYEEAAIRETMEELNLERQHIDVIAELDYIVSERDVIHCFVGIISDVEFEEIKPNEEVAELYTLPVTYILENEPEYFEVASQVEGMAEFLQDILGYGPEYAASHHVQNIPFYQLEKYRLWGYTANLTVRFAEILKMYGFEDWEWDDE